LGPFVNREGKPIPPLADDEIVLNSWAADDLAMQGVKLQPGDPIELTYFEPESTHGKVVETRHVFHLKDIVQLAGAAADRDLTPEVKGVTDEASIADWNPPFPYDQNRVRATPPNNQDDDYWRKYRATPKAFVSLSEGQKLWGSRFGNITSIRISPDVNSAQSLSEQAVADRLLAAFQPAALGFEFLPVKRLSLAAAAGTTPFAMLFLAFSFFIIAAALVLVILLFKLAIDMRATELGIILAVGLRRSFARRMLLIEGFGIALVGALAGILAGIGYAWLMLVGLKTWWLGAISTPFLELYVQPQSLIIGFACGLVAALATIVWALRQTRRVSARQLMAGQIEPPRSSFARQARWTTWIVAALVVMAVGSSVAAFFMNGEAQAGAFMGAGALVLAALLVWQRDLLRYGPRFLRLEGNSGSLVRLALRNVGRNPLRSILTISLTASACFLIFAVSAFQLDPPKHGPSLTSGDGGFALVANSDQPIYQDINSEVNGKPLGTESFPLRVQAGDDASCLNLYQPRQPRVLGVPENLIQRGGFAWGANTAETQDEKQNPWLLLNGKSVDRRGSQPGNASASSSDADAIPVVLDQNTAMYSLHLGEGAGQIFEIDHPSGGKIKLQVIGVLTNSIFQGDLLMSEANFLRTFPGASGYQFFLIDCPADKLSAVADSLESTYGDEGLEVQTTAARLAAFFVVQNTYLATFRSLGGLGLLLGTFGLAAVQLRSIVERRGELALLQAVGFRRRRLALLVLLEQAALLLAGLATGALAALVALAPHLLAGGAGIPWWSLATTLAVIFAVGLLAGSIAVKAVLKAPVLAALRGS
jgi:ABC-type antimicrobial peptide transport system permease subunit